MGGAGVDELCVVDADARLCILDRVFSELERGGVVCHGGLLRPRWWSRLALGLGALLMKYSHMATAAVAFFLSSFQLC